MPVNQAQGAEATVESEGSALETESPQQEEVYEVTPLLGAVLAEMKGQKVVGQEEATPPAEPPDLTPSPAQPPETETTAPPAIEPAPVVQEPPKVEGQPEGQTPASEEEAPVPVQWPKTAKARVAEEADKRRKRTVERDQALSQRDQVLAERDQARLLANQWAVKAQELNQELQARGAATARPSEQDPLADVITLPQLAQAAKLYTDLREFAERGLADETSATDVLLGRDEAGNEVRHTYSRAELADMKIKAERILNNQVPPKLTLLQAQAQAAQEAATEHPELWKDAETNAMALQIVQIMPEIRRFPDYLMMIGDFLAYRRDRLSRSGANGATAPASAAPGRVSSAARKIVEQSRIRVAPGGPARRVPTPMPSAPADEVGTTSNAEIEAAKERMRKEGTPESMEAFISASLRQKRGPHQPALI